MPQACQICNHPQRLAIDRELVAGKSYKIIQNIYGIDWQAVRRHKENHLSRQLVSAYTKKSEEWALELLDHLRDIVFKAAAIFDRAYAKNTSTADTVALRALSEQRGVFELLAKIVAFSQVKAMEEQQAQQAERVDLSGFTMEELQVLLKAGLRIAEANGDPVLDLSPELLGEPAPVPWEPGPPELQEAPTPAPRPLPRPSKVPQQPIEAVPEPEPGEQEPEKAGGLPPAPCTEIPGGRGLRLKRHLLGKKIYDSMRER